MDEDNEVEQDEEFVFDDEYLTWDAVSKPIGVEEDTYQTRLSKGKNVIHTSAKIVEKTSTSKTRVPAEIVLRDDDVEVEDEEANEYNEEEKDYTNIEEVDKDIGVKENW
ncbi:hypothetical protein KSP39_PZI006308 [Platanthera zijinensis]|uniref:Uncharacterized protein n=1 Tax=Platanthera zijinensis TaxID=2320716 RepID=A0AAP0BRJ2_9ASPA